MKPARLNKKEDAIFMFRGKYGHIIVPFLIILLIILMLVLFAVIIDIATAHNNTMVMVESGQYYNHLKDVI